jgi:hypothetical protein
MTIQELEIIGEVRMKRGHSAKVRICDAGNGPAVDVREFISAEKYRAEDSRIVGAGRKAGSAKTRSTYVGPTRSGLWITPEQALQLADQLATAALKAQTWTIEQAHADALLEDSCRYDAETAAA